jgi:hypothetical protein
MLLGVCKLENSVSKNAEINFAGQPILSRLLPLEVNWSFINWLMKTLVIIIRRLLRPDLTLQL